MARRPEGWKLVTDTRTGLQLVRFRHEKKRYKLATGERDLGRATTKAASIYAEIVSGRWDRSKVEAPRPGAPLEDTVAEWLADAKSEIGADTFGLYKIHMWAHLIPFFESLDRITPLRIVDYRRARMKKVLRATVVKELGTLRRFLRWAKENSYISAVPLIESPPLTSIGTPDDKMPHKAGAVSLDAEEAQAIIERLPEVSSRARRGSVRFPIRDAFIVYWETGLRPTTIAKLECPRHYHKGATHLDITKDIDKSQYDRRVPLTERCRVSLDRWARPDSLIFGEHDYRIPFGQAAAKAAEDGKLAHHKADRTSPYDFRHGRATELASSTNNLAGVSYLLGHKKVSTTALYVNAQEKAASDVLEAVSGRIRVSEDSRPNQVKTAKPKIPQSFQPSAKDGSRTRKPFGASTSKKRKKT